jgi:hypothetical protein
MHFHLPKPLHGWRGFIGEVGIIVVGVLIALGAEQLVEQWHWRNKVAETSAQFDTELHRNAQSAYGWLVVDSCLDRQLDAIDAGLFEARRTGHLRPLPAFTPPLQIFTEDAWLNARALQVSDHIPPDQVEEYARLYFLPRDLMVSVVELHKEGAELRPLTAGLSPVSLDEIGAYQRQVGRVRELVDRVALGNTLLIRRLREDGIRLSAGEMREALESNRAWAGACAATPDPNRRFAPGD